MERAYPERFVESELIKVDEKKMKIIFTLNATVSKTKAMNECRWCLHIHHSSQTFEKKF